MNALYLLINLGAVSVPFAFSFHPRLRFYRRWGAAFTAIALPLLIFLPWDALFTVRGHWGFSPEYITGIRLGNLPLEEILFFICIPYACLFTYYSLNLKGQSAAGNRHPVHFALAAIYFLIGLLFYDRAYTATTFFLLFAFQLVSIFFYRGNLFRFYAAYAILLIPFFIVNGLLTGTGIEGQVVWYNNSENLGLRLLTIPVEDVFYGMLLVQMNVFVFEWVRSKKPSTTRRDSHPVPQKLSADAALRP